MNTPLRLAATAALTLAAQVAVAQQPADTTRAAIPEIGSVAPDFTFRAITSTGIAPAVARLSDLRGQTVVLWFFVKARTRG
jgi:hypothetical protein